MPDITSAIEALMTSLLVNRQTLMMRANKLGLALLFFCGIGVSVGLFFLALALYQYLADLYRPYVAALVSSAFTFTAVIVAAIVTFLLQRKKAPTHQPALDEFGKNIHVLVRDICTELEEPVRENPKTSVAVAALAGLFAARRI